MGPAGAVGVTVSVIYFAYFFAIGCNEGGCPPWPVDRFLIDGARRMGTKAWWVSLWDTQAMVVYLAWYTWTVVCWAVLPGRMRTPCCAAIRVKGSWSAHHTVTEPSSPCSIDVSTGGWVAGR